VRVAPPMDFPDSVVQAVWAVTTREAEPPHADIRSEAVMATNAKAGLNLS